MRVIPYTKRTHESIAADVAAAQAGDIDARNRVITHNLRLVVKHAHAFALRVGRLDLIDDLVQAATLGDEGATRERRGGLLRAIETYDPTCGTKFSTHARSWILLEIRRALSRAGMQRVDTVRRHALIVRVRDELRERLGEEPTYEQLRAEWLERGHSAKRCTPTAVDRALGRAGKCVSYDALTDESPDDETRMGMRAAVQVDGSQPDETAIAATLDNGLDAQRALSCLTEQERITITRLFGIGCAEMSIPEFARSRGVTRQRVSFIKNRALAKMRGALQGGDTA